MKRIYISIFALFVGFSQLFAQTEWGFDKTHTQIKFTVTHLLITEVDGYFNSYDGTVKTSGDDFTNAEVKFNIDVNSINTDNEKRDAHLKSDDFFAAEKYPQISFVSKSMEKVDDKHYKLVGDLTMRGVTKEVELKTKINGIVKDPWGNTKAGLKISGTLNRFDFGLNWNKLIEAGGAVVSEEVELDINVQLIKK